MSETARRTIALLAVVAAVSAPALLLRALCVGASCERREAPTATVPFCSLPRPVRDRLAAGFRDGRSPDVLAVAGPETPVAGADGYERLAPPWPSAGGGAVRVPLAFTGAAVRADVPAGTGLVQVAPTIAGAIRLERPFPEVRSGAPIPGVHVPEAPRLVLLVVWKGVDSADLEARLGRWPTLEAIVAAGSGTLDADPGSLPVDPTAVMATIGTGGMPAEHGITGSVVRNDAGEAVAAWGPDAPFSVIAALGDDLDDVLGQAPRIGVIGTSRLDRGLIGEDWYVEHDRDDEVLVGSAAEAVEAARRLLATGYGEDDAPDLLAVALEGPLRAMDRATRDLLELAFGASDGAAALGVVTATGSTSQRGEALAAGSVAEQVERKTDAAGLVEATATGGLFLRQDLLAGGVTSRDRVIRALASVEGDGRVPVMADAFAGTAIEFGRFCR